MLNTHRLNRHAALSNSRGGFTLVELLVVIGIIAILAGVALGPITNGIKKAQQSAGLQSAHAIGLAMYAFANDNQQLYPDTGNPGVPSGNAAAGALAAAQPLMAGGYVTDPTIFGLSGDANPAYVKVSNITNTALTIGVAQISWDFLGNGGAGVNSTSFPFLPLLWSTCSVGGGGQEPATFNVAAGGAITAIPGTSNPFGTSGLAVFYINNASAFVTTSIQAGVLKASLVSGANNLGGAPATYVPLPGT
jgi:prepilin-type N-terminal cleavage/methylation domain-containing protein